jgi:hypothetical protein
LAEQNDEWLVGHHFFSLGSMAKLLEPAAEAIELAARA